MSEPVGEALSEGRFTAEVIGRALTRCVGLPVEVVASGSLDWMPVGAIVAFHDTAVGHGTGQFDDPGHDLRRDIASRLDGLLRLIHFPTPRGLTVGEVL